METYSTARAPHHPHDAGGERAAAAHSGPAQEAPTESVEAAAGPPASFRPPTTTCPPCPTSPATLVRTKPPTSHINTHDYTHQLVHAREQAAAAHTRIGSPASVAQRRTRRNSPGACMRACLSAVPGARTNARTPPNVHANSRQPLMHINGCKLTQYHRVHCALSLP